MPATTPIAAKGGMPMRIRSKLFRLTATTAIVGVALGPLLAQSAFSEASPPPIAPPATSPPAQPTPTVDPPSRVGRLSRLTGEVSFHDLGADHWDQASVNFPVTSGNSFWTQPGASADIGVTNNRTTMDQSTEFDITTLDDENVVASVPQGQIYLRLLSPAPGERYTIATPRGAVAITARGHYEISAGDTQNPTRVTVVNGSAQISGSNIDLQVAANQTVLITGNDPFQTQVVPAQHDAFLTAQLARDRPPAGPAGLAAPAVVQDMTGGEELSQYGAWQQVPQYGTVWYPQVAAGYVPYRNGHWVYVAPWGWTWVDAAPWGFAPFHYGRWVQVGGRWGWAPGGGVGVTVAVGSPGYARPVYAPALVSFFGVGVGLSVGVGLGAAAGNIGWCPLGWQEPYRPWYHASPAYVRNVNVVSVRNVTNITTVNNTTINNYVNRSAATVVPATAMVDSRPVAQAARPVSPTLLAGARPVIGQEPITPTAATAGVTPRVAQELHLPPAPAAANRPAAPGPVIRAQAATSTARLPLETAKPEGAAATQPSARPASPNAATVPHAPGPATEPRGTAAAPALHPPAEAARPEPVVPHETPRARPPAEAARPEQAVPHEAPAAHPPVAAAEVPHPVARPTPEVHPPVRELAPQHVAAPPHEAVPHREPAPREEGPQHRPTEPQAMREPPPRHVEHAASRPRPQEAHGPHHA
jgi:hypothetical protein